MSVDLTKPYEILFQDDIHLGIGNIRTPYLKQGDNYYTIKGEWLTYTNLPVKNIFPTDRRRTHNETYFTSVYDKLTSYKSLSSIKKYQIKKPNEVLYEHSQERANEFTIKVLNQFKEGLIKNFQTLTLQKKQEKLENIETTRTPEQSKERQTKLIKDYEYNRRSRRLDRQIQRKINDIDERNEPELFKQHQEQLKPKTKLEKTLTFKPIVTDYPYRSANKLKSLYDEYDESKVKHYNNFNIKQSKKDYSLKTFSKIPNSYIGDIFFQGKKFAFLLLININTRYAYAYQLGDVDVKEVINIDDNQKEYEIKYATKGQKQSSH